MQKYQRMYLENMYYCFVYEYTHTHLVWKVGVVLVVCEMKNKERYLNTFRNKNVVVTSQGNIFDEFKPSHY
jgi:hypothetical protein